MRAIQRAEALVTGLCLRNQIPGLLNCLIWLLGLLLGLWIFWLPEERFLDTRLFSSVVSDGFKTGLPPPARVAPLLSSLNFRERGFSFYSRIRIGISNLFFR